MIGRNEAKEIETQLLSLEPPLLSVYADVDPSNPDNKGGSWRIRVKNALKDIAEIHERTKHRPSLYDQVVSLIEEERPAAKTMALFATQNKLGKTFLQRVDLNVSLPVVDVTCRIPDDYISKNRYPLFMARAVMRGLIESLQSLPEGSPC